MRKLLLYIAVLSMVLCVCFIAAKTRSVDFTNRYLDHASFYGLKNLVHQDEVIVEEYSHLDSKFWGVPEMK